VNWFLRFLINAIVLYLIAKYVPGFNHAVTIWTAVIAAIIFGLVNMLIGPILRLLSAPLTWITHGAFSIVINYILFAITIHFANFYDPTSGVNPWLADLYGAIIMMLVSTLTNEGSRTEASRSA
jgi:putative membrane protein